MRRIILIKMLMLAAVATMTAQLTFNPEEFRVFDSSGRVTGLDAVVNEIAADGVVFLGEQHDDAVGHAVQAEIFRRIVEKYKSDRTIALSLEMFERDVQVVLNEYLAGLIPESHFLASSRPWGNYTTDYKPLVELAKKEKLPVIAANAPRRYVNMVSRGGRDALRPLSKEARTWLAPLPYAEPSKAYAAKFKLLMGDTPEAQSGIDKILASQSLWDATMADSISQFLKRSKKPLVVHLNGGFHTEGHLGTAEQLQRYRSKTKSLVITILYEDDYKTFDPAKHTRLGDYVILTNAKQPRSRR